MVGFAICSYLKTQGPLVASLGLSLLLRSLTTERRRSSLKSLLPDGENLGFSRQTPVFPGFAGVLETRQNPGKQGVNRRNTQETRRCNPAETGRVIGKTRVNPGMGKPKPPLIWAFPGGHVFYLATNDAKTKHSAHSQINLTPVDQQGVG